MEIERLLAQARFRATSFSVVNARAPWGVQAPEIDYAIIYGVIEGSIWFEGGGVSCILESGDLVMMPHGGPHRLTSSRDVETTEPLMELLRRKPGNYIFNHGGDGAAIQFIAGGSLWDEAARTIVARLLPEAIIVRKHMIPSPSHIAVLEELIVKEANSPRIESGVMINGLFNLLLTEMLAIVLPLSGASSVAPSRQPSSSKIARALLLIHGPTASEWTAASLAQRVGLSRAAFSKRFRNETGLAPGAYLKQLRLQRAAELLRGSDAEIAEAAEFAGYSSIPSFSQAFKAKFGASPHAWRRSPP